MDHVFCNGQVAVYVWNFFGSASGVLNLGCSVRAYIAGWWYSASRNGFLAFVHFIIPSLICWNIWKSRNLARFEGKFLSHVAICEFVFEEVKNLFRLQFPEHLFLSSTWMQFYSSLSSLNRIASFKIVRWCRPPLGVFKLNTDGCSRGNVRRAGGGGILRDDEGFPARFFLIFWKWNQHSS